jgi:hypothetical protein
MPRKLYQTPIWITYRNQAGAAAINEQRNIITSGTNEREAAITARQRVTREFGARLIKTTLGRTLPL